jgi:hypothetical protein
MITQAKTRKLKTAPHVLGFLHPAATRIRNHALRCQMMGEIVKDAAAPVAASYALLTKNKRCYQEKGCYIV